MALSKAELLSIIVRGARESGWSVLFLSHDHPFRLQISRGDESHRVRIYVWNLTGGGAPRSSSEYRIQVTGIGDRFASEIGGKTLILGWWEGAEVFAGFDFRRHHQILGASPSLQVREEPLREAHHNGFSAYRKGNGETVIAFRPEFLGEYVRNLESLHQFGESEQDLNILGEVAKNPSVINDAQIQALSEPRRTTVTSVRRKLRDSSFRSRVLTAYGYRCAVCALQLNLVDAAHIVPVVHPSSTDETSNGIALCSLHHRAYDRALIVVDEDYRVVVDEVQTAQLEILDRAGGLDSFIDSLKPLIILPPSPSDRPNVNYLRTANALRDPEPV